MLRVLRGLVVRFALILAGCCRRRHCRRRSAAVHTIGAVLKARGDTRRFGASRGGSGGAQRALSKRRRTLQIDGRVSTLQKCL